MKPEHLKLLRNKDWRLNNLYWITDKEGKPTRFRMTPEQREYFEGIHTRNIILKARQLGFTTEVCIIQLDAALFESAKCALIAHTLNDAKRLFREKVKYAYDKLPAEIKAANPASNDSSGELVFKKGGSLYVSTSFRGGTLRYLHVSEFGKICAKFPHKAREIVTGAFEAVSTGCFATIESTAEGRAGYFFDYCQTAEKALLQGKQLSALDWKFFFFSWWKNPLYAIDPVEPLPARLVEYFAEMEAKHGVALNERQKAWYHAKEKTLGDDMKREYPTIPAEAFQQSVEGAYYAKQFRWLYTNKRIGQIPDNSHLPVHTFWDIGVGDSTAIWFVREVGTEFHVSRLTNALADSLGVSIGQLRAMAAEGKLTTDVVVKGLLSQGEAIGSEFAKTTVSISKGLQVAGNNVTKFFGENATVKSFAAGFRDSVISLSENLESLGTALIGAAAIMGGRFAGALAMATVAQAQRVQGTLTSISATRQAAIQEAEAAAVTVRKTQADKGAAMSALNLALAEFQVAKNTAAEAFAMENVVRLRSAYIATAAEAAVAENALAGAQARVAATGFTMANTMKVISTVTGPLGGPLGVIAIVAAGWYLYAQRQAEARKEAIAFADTIPEVIKRLNDMNLAQSQGVRADTVDSIKAQKDSISDLKDTISGLESEYEKYATLAKQYGVSEDENNGYVIKAKEAANNLAKARRDLDGQTSKLQQTEDALHLINIRVNQGIVDQMKAARDNALALAEAEKKASLLGGSQAFLAQKLGQSTEALKAFNSETLKINWGGKEGEKLIKQAERRLALSKLEGEARAKLQATYDAEDSGVDDPRAVQRLQETYIATEKATQAKKDQKKEDKEAASEAKKAANQQESIAQKLSNLKQQSELAADSTRELSREQAILTAQQSLGKGATQEQIALAGKYASAKWDAANAIKAQAAAEKLLPEARENASFKQDVQDLNTALSAKKISQEQYNQTMERLEETHQANLAKIRSDQVVSPQQEAAGGIDPVQQLANENARKLALIQQYEQQGIITHQNALALRASADKEYEQARVAAQWEIWRNQSAGNEALAASFDALAGNASNALTGIITGSMSAEEAIRSIGNTVLNSLINSFVQMGVEWVKSAIMGQAAQTAAIGTVTAVQTAAVATQTATSTAAAATTAAAWTPAAILSSIASMGTAAAIGIGAVAGIVGMSLLGKRKNGGPVTAGGLYQVGEGGMPEIYQASTGKQYMIPGDNGKVISNKNMTVGGGGGVVINIQNYSSSSVDAQAGTDGNGGLTVDVIVADLNNGGPISSGITSNFNVKRTPRGQG